MPDQVVIEHLEFQGHCGVSEVERAISQPLAVDIVLDYPPRRIPSIAERDSLAEAVDYTRVVQRAIDLGTKQPYHLLETLADNIASTLLSEFQVERVRLWLRKVATPIKEVQGSVGVRLDRTRDASQGDLAPSRFLVDSLALLTRGTALDIAAGAGRNALYLASEGFTVEALDRDHQALTTLSSMAKERNLSDLSTRSVDLEAGPDSMAELGRERYDVILVFFYLHRPLFPTIIEALKPGGCLLYETFLIDNHLRHHHPRRKEFCLAHNELLDLTRALRVLHYEEGEHQDGHGRPSAYTARLLARKGDL